MCARACLAFWHVFTKHQSRVALVLGYYYRKGGDHHHHSIVMVRIVCIEYVSTLTRGRFVDGLEFCFHTRTHTHPTYQTYRGMRAALRKHFLRSKYRKPTSYQLMEWSDVATIEDLWDFQQVGMKF